MNWELIRNIGALIGCVGGLCGLIGLLRSLRKPKARLRFSNGKKQLTFYPHYCRAVALKYYVGPQFYSCDASAYQAVVEEYNRKLKQANEFNISFRLTNTGRLQLENYRVEINFRGIQSFAPITKRPRRVVGNYIEPPAADDIVINRGKPQIVYSPMDKLPLNQNDYKDFSFRFSPHPDAERIILQWRISAKDFSKSGKLMVNLLPTVDEYDEIHFANCERDIPQGAEVIVDLTPYIEDMKEKLKKII